MSDLLFTAPCGCTADDIAGHPRVDADDCKYVKFRKSYERLVGEVERLLRVEIVLTDALQRVASTYSKQIDRDEVFALPAAREEFRAVASGIVAALGDATEIDPWILDALREGIPPGALMSPLPDQRMKR